MLINWFKKYDNRPKLKIKPTAFDIIIDAISFVLLVLMLFTVIQVYADLPNSIPIHFGSGGLVDEYGDKQLIWLLPGIGFIAFVVMIILNKFPHKFNYLVRITEQNAKQQYTIATHIVRFVNLIMTLIFFYITDKTLNIALQKSAPTLGKWFAPTILSVVIVVIIVIVVVSVFKNKKLK